MSKRFKVELVEENDREYLVKVYTSDSQGKTIGNIYTYSVESHFRAKLAPVMDLLKRAESVLVTIADDVQYADAPIIDLLEKFADDVS